MSILKGIYRFQDEVFEIVQTSPDSATLGLLPKTHVTDEMITEDG